MSDGDLSYIQIVPKKECKDLFALFEAFSLLIVSVCPTSVRVEDLQYLIPIVYKQISSSWQCTVDKYGGHF